MWVEAGEHRKAWGHFLLLSFLAVGASLVLLQSGTLPVVITHVGFQGFGSDGQENGLLLDLETLYRGDTTTFG